MKNGHCLLKNILWIFPALLWSPAIAFGQAQSDAPPASPSSQQSSSQTQSHITTGMKDNIAYIQDRNAQLQELEKHKADLQKQLDELQDEGRKVGAPSSWFR